MIFRDIPHERTMLTFCSTYHACIKGAKSTLKSLIRILRFRIVQSSFKRSVQFNVHQMLLFAKPRKMKLVNVWCSGIASLVKKFSNISFGWLCRNQYNDAEVFAKFLLGHKKYVGPRQSRILNSEREVAKLQGSGRRYANWDTFWTWWGTTRGTRLAAFFPLYEVYVA